LLDQAKTQNRKKRRKKTEETHFNFVLTSSITIALMSLRAVGLLIFFFSLAVAGEQAVVGVS
jgi:hypothetical protein